MSTETEQNINEAIDWLQATGASIQDFTIEQTPLYCKEIVAWEAAYGLSLGGLGLLLIVMAAFLFRGAYKAANEDDNMAEGKIVSFIPTGIVSVIVGVILFSSIFDGVKALVAPRLVIVEHFQQLTK